MIEFLRALRIVLGFVSVALWARGMPIWATALLIGVFSAGAWWLERDRGRLEYARGQVAEARWWVDHLGIRR
jgi:hypothetical protein